MSITPIQRQLSTLDFVNQFKHMAKQNAIDLLQAHEFREQANQIVTVTGVARYEGKCVRFIQEFSSPFIQRLASNQKVVKDDTGVDYYPLKGYPTVANGVATHVTRFKEADQLYFDALPFEDEVICRLSDSPIFPTQSYTHQDGVKRKPVGNAPSSRSSQVFMNWKIQNQDFFITTNDFMGCVKNIPGLRHVPNNNNFQSALNGIMKEVMQELKDRDVYFKPTNSLNVSIKRLEACSNKFIGWVSPNVNGGSWQWSANFYGNGEGDTYLVDIVFPNGNTHRRVYYY